MGLKCRSLLFQLRISPCESLWGSGLVESPANRKGKGLKKKMLPWFVWFEVAFVNLARSAKTLCKILIWAGKLLNPIPHAYFNHGTFSHADETNYLFIGFVLPWFDFRCLVFSVLVVLLVCILLHFPMILENMSMQNIISNVGPHHPKINKIIMKIGVDFVCGPPK